MNVADLIELLKSMPADALVVCHRQDTTVYIEMIEFGEKIEARKPIIDHTSFTVDKILYDMGEVEIVLDEI